MSKTTKITVADFLQKKYKLSSTDSMTVVETFLATAMQMANTQSGVVLKNFGKLALYEKKLVKNLYDFQNKVRIDKQINVQKIVFTPSKNLKNNILCQK